MYQTGGTALIKQILNVGLFPFRDINNEPVISIKQSNEIIEKIKYLCMDERENFDKDLNIINVKNGLYNWKTGEFKEHTPDYKTMIQINIIYNPEATCPVIDEVLREVIPKDKYNMCMDFIAYLLYRNYNIKSFLLLYGPPGTGKSIFMDLLVKFIGESNCAHQSLDSLTNNKYAFGKLYGKSLNVCGDLDQNAITKTGWFKAATGRDKLSIDQKYKDMLDFYNFAKFVFGTNIAPPVNDNSNGFIKRLLIVMFLRVYKREESDFTRICKMHEEKELSGLFNKVIKLLPELVNRNYITDTPTEEETKKEYDALSNTILMFSNKCIFEDPESYGIFKTTLYQEYVKICKKFVVVPLEMNAFNKELIKLNPYIRGGQKMNKNLSKRQASWQNVSLTHWFD